MTYGGQALQLHQHQRLALMLVLADQITGSIRLADTAAAAAAAAAAANLQQCHLQPNV
jgi:hypothetical protein